ncbi:MULTISPECIES: hypothetical protein [Loigolactobacillus]|uniref:hypothetical protein n=1 Tax=Loigolactobacillus TaxID=2767889 RepID=UPI000F73A123|nr:MULTISPECIES: hypothetical protein [Loigolactobacillus]MBW4803775.1 hypothetical protein [Loigolactobacillus coryniformis subsp. torquens]MBW4806477.1 hypothetical protein [Loigolactobacillus coryniformis subsp. torquens]MCL5458050.1 hypothetical protein [Loigolactobacillus coryniformis]
MAESMVEHIDNLTRDEARKIIEPLLANIKLTYMTIDQKKLEEIMCVSDSYFRNHFANQPEMRIIEHRAPQEDGRKAKKILYFPDEAEQAIRKIIAKW